MKPEDIKIGKYYTGENGEDIFYVRNIWLDEEPDRLSDNRIVSYEHTAIKFGEEVRIGRFNLALTWFATMVRSEHNNGKLPLPKRRLNITSITRAPDNKSLLQRFLEEAEQVVAELNKPERYESFELHRAWARGVDDYHQAMKSLIQKQMED